MKQKLTGMFSILLIGVILMFLLSGCSLFAKKYNVSYDWKDSYEGAKDSYRAGTLVKLTYQYIATDTDYYFSVTGADGTDIPLQHGSFYGEIRFIMPEQDVTVATDSRNTMTYQLPPFEDE